MKVRMRLKQLKYPRTQESDLYKELTKHMSLSEDIFESMANEIRKEEDRSILEEVKRVAWEVKHYA